MVKGDMDNAYIAIARYIKKNKDNPGGDISLESVGRFANLAVQKEKADRLRSAISDVRSAVDEQLQKNDSDRVRKKQSEKISDVLLNLSAADEKVCKISEKLNDLMGYNNKLSEDVLNVKSVLNEKIDGVLSRSDRISETTANDLKSMSEFIFSGQQKLKDELIESVHSSVGKTISVEQVRETMMSVLPKVERKQVQIKETGQVITLEKK